MPVQSLALIITFLFLLLKARYFNVGVWIVVVKVRCVFAKVSWASYIVYTKQTCYLNGGGVILSSTSQAVLKIIWNYSMLFCGIVSYLLLSQSPQNTRKWCLCINLSWDKNTFFVYFWSTLSKSPQITVFYFILFYNDLTCMKPVLMDSLPCRLNYNEVPRTFSGTRCLSTAGTRV